MVNGVLDPTVKGSPYEKDYVEKIDKWNKDVGYRIDDLSLVLDIIEYCIGQYTFEEYEALTKKHDILLGTVNASLDDVINDPHVLAGNYIRKVCSANFGEYRTPDSPVVFEKSKTPAFRPAPELDADRKEVLRMIGHNGK
jgi:crotonobetainyl-CoA:carnitine CoA-transferase CaiB-like acyl-CoA transferase